MTVPVQTPFNNYVGNAATTAFSYNFLVLLASDLIVKVSGVTLVNGVDYTVSGIGSVLGGAVTMTSAPASLAPVAIYRSTAITRAVDYQSNGDFLAPTVNADFDRPWLVLQELFSGPSGFGRMVKVPVGETMGDLPAASVRAGNLLSFDSNGNPLAVAAVSGTATQLTIDLASSALATKNAGQIGFNYALGYASGTIGRWLQDLATSAGSGFIGFIASGVGAVLRTLQSKARDFASVLDYGAGIAGLPVSMALGGRTYRIPPGTYTYTTGLLADYSSVGFADYLSPSLRVSLIGDAMPNTFLEYNGTAATYALTLKGPTSFASLGVYSASEYRNLTFKDSGATQTRNGISITNQTDVKFEDITLYRFNVGMYINSSLSSIFRNIKHRYCNQGLVLDNTTGQSNPNAISFTDCDWTANIHQGIIANVMGATNRFSSCRIESNGVQGTGTDGGATFTINTNNGLASMLFESCYFEANAGGFDVFLTNASATAATVIFQNCEFHRLGLAQYVTTNIGAANSGGGSLRVVLTGCAFMSGGTYVPSGARPFFTAGDSKVVFIDGGGNVFSEDTSRATAFYNAGGRVNGSTGAIVTGASAYSSVRSSAGVYVVTSTLPFGPTTNDIVVDATPLSAFALSATVEVLSSTSFRVTTRVMNTGAVSDCDFSFNVIGLKG